MAVTKLDLRKQLKPFYFPHGVELVQLPPLKYIMVEGNGEPGGESFQQAMAVVYALAYALKFRAKKLLKKDYSVMAPEGLWWTKSGKIDLKKPNQWLWTLMVVVPDFVTTKLFLAAVDEVRRKKNPPGLDAARLEAFDEGYCVQTMHVGPYSSEPESIAKMEAYAREHGYVMVGKHHEIYLGDPRRSAPSKLKTILRHPVAEGP